MFAVYLGLIGADFRVEAPGELAAGELADSLRKLAARYLRAVSPG